MKPADLAGAMGAPAGSAGYFNRHGNIYRGAGGAG